ncbi:MAG: hypothetical protein PSV17_09540 [Methylotenera sp.]|uniref:hypothetical protein n=1 Tax=Methylotenera sp. TaxID=2051956 RepID=UPI002488A02B|nr:hypothetical protein [Methylotenera sp.]MDI1309659.1 hypothetical protein [Methylotenera sp.]
MQEYIHYVSGVFESRETANNAAFRLIQKGFKQENIQIFDKDSNSPIENQMSESDAVLKDMIVDGAIGTAVGTGIAGLTGVALIAANVTLFVASPLLAPLTLLGWGASLGGTIGATIGSKVESEGKSGWFSDFITDAITNNQFVLVVATTNQQEVEIAKKEIEIFAGAPLDTVSAPV